MFLLLLCVSLFAAQPPTLKRWVKCELENEKINTVLTYKEVLLVGTDNGLIYGLKNHETDTTNGAPIYTWDFSKLDSHKVSSIAVLEDGTIYAITENGLYYIETNLWHEKEVDWQWTKDTTFNNSECTKLQGKGEVIYLSVNDKIYKRDVATTWYPILDISPQEPSSLHDFRVCGDTLCGYVVVAVFAREDQVQSMFSFFVSENDGETWFSGPNDILNLVDYTYYKKGASDQKLNLAYVQYDNSTNKSSLTYLFDIVEKNEKREQSISGTVTSIDVSSVSWGFNPFFFIASSDSVYLCNLYDGPQAHSSSPHQMKNVYVTDNDMKEVLTHNDSTLYYYVRWNGPVNILTSKKVQKEIPIVSQTKEFLLCRKDVVRVEVFSSRGQIIKTFYPNRIMGQKLPLSDLVAGVYLIKSYTKNNSYSRKICLREF